MKRLLNLQYSPIGLSKNNPVPKWLNCHISEGVIHLSGVPSINDQGHILIRIIDKLQLIVYSYRLLIKDRSN